MVNSCIDKMVLGTAQLGKDYGIANQSGRCSPMEAHKILETAWEAGIKQFDTAPSYSSEAIIGDFIKSNRIDNEIIICTKIPSIGRQPNWKSFLFETVQSSLNKLRCSSIHVLFFHDPKDSHFLIHNPGIFHELLSSYPISNLGISVYSPNEVEKLGDCGFDLAFQFPYNFLDRRFEANDIRNGKRYARSIFLQGILASKTGLKKTAPDALKEIHKNVHAFFEKKGINALNFALRFVANSVSIDYFLFGVDNKEQLDQILAIDFQGYQYDGELDQLISSIDKNWLDPRKWN